MTEKSLMSTAAFERARQHVVLALDVASLDEAVALTRMLSPYVGTVKVGLELYLAEGRASIAALLDCDVDVFLDLKLHDIPTTVERAARAVGNFGARYLTVHTSGGEQMVRACVDGLRESASAGGHLPAIAAGVTVLTSDSVANPTQLAQRAALAKNAGCGALVCAAPDLPITKNAAPGLLTVVPGTRPTGAPSDDQARILSPRAALDLGADLLVLGRPILKAVDPCEAAYEIACSLMEES